jgi:hypothetical protein
VVTEPKPGRDDSAGTFENGRVGRERTVQDAIREKLMLDDPSSLAEIESELVEYLEQFRGQTDSR